MSRALTLLILLAVPLAGCLETPAEDVTTEATTTAETVATITVPEPIEDTQMVVGSADPFNFVGMGVCAPSAKCFRYPFALDGTAKATASLAWGIPATDFDLYLLTADGEAITMDGATPPGTSEAIEETLDAGDYEFLVVGWAVVQDTFTFRAEFAAVAAPPAEDAPAGNATATTW